jgi:Transposase, Mutator family
VRYPPEQWRSSRTTNAIERLHEEFKRRIKTQCLLPCAETAAMLFWALLASGQITMRRVDGWQTSPPDPDHHAFGPAPPIPPHSRHDPQQALRRQPFKSDET